jgi:hypothetical protein
MGACGVRGTKKSTPFAAQIVLQFDGGTLGPIIGQTTWALMNYLLLTIFVGEGNRIEEAQN